MRPYKIDKSLQWNGQLKKLLPGGRHSNFLYEDKISNLHFINGKGGKIWDADGNEYLDLCGKYGSQFLGHCNPDYNGIIEMCMHKVLSADLSEWDYTVCRYLCTHISCCDQVRFNLSGSEAIFNALRLARTFTGKSKIIRFSGHFHGASNGTLIEEKSKNLVELPWNKPQILARYLEKHHNKIAGIIMEPLCMSSGGIAPAAGYLKRVRDLCNDYQVVLIFDEVITGVRTRLGGLQEKYGVTPDLCVFAKGLGNGVPVASIMGKSRLMRLYETLQVIHGGTYNGYPLGMAAVYATFTILTNLNKDYYHQMKRFNKKMLELFFTIANRFNLTIQLQGEENCYALNCADAPVTSMEAWSGALQYKNTILRGCLQRYGILLSPVSRIYTNISLCENDLNFLESRLALAFREAKQILQKVAV